MNQLVAERFARDPRVAQAKQLLLEALREHQQGITGIRPPDPGRAVTYAELLEEFGMLRAGALYYPYLGSGIGNGPLVELADGSVKYDFISGIGVHHWGHSHPEIVGSALEAALRDTVMQGNLQQDAACVDLARTLTAAANSRGASLTHCFFSTSGAMANENALKLIFQKKHPADRLLAFDRCFMGRSLALCQITDKPAYREGLPGIMAVDYVSFFDPKHPHESTQHAVDQVRRHLARYPGRHAGMIFELIQGEGGFYPGEAAFFRAIMEVLREHDLAIMVDEIQTFGRTEGLFAYQHFGLDEFVDVVTVGKLLQVCASLFSEKYRPGPGLLSQTFSASTSAIFAARTILSRLLAGDFFGADGKNSLVHKRFVQRLQETEARHLDLVEGPYGLGAMIAFTAFKGDAQKVKAFVQALFAAGVIAFFCGSEVTRVRFLVPVAAITLDQIDEVAAIVERVLLEVAQAESLSER
ncbi:MAG: aminotransferase class III-fold pyridoxal phosphate-dependent enzyme [Thermodesulfobacteriota bacterium]